MADDVPKLSPSPPPSSRATGSDSVQLMRLKTIAIKIRPTSVQDWFKNLIQSVEKAFNGRLPRGSYTLLTPIHNEIFHQNFSEKQFKNRYNYYKFQKGFGGPQEGKNVTFKPTATESTAETAEPKPKADADADAEPTLEPSGLCFASISSSHPQTSTSTSTSTSLALDQSMLDLVELTINEAILKFIVLKQNDQRIFTPRIDRKRFNKQLFDAIDNFYISRDLASQIHSIDDLIDYLYIAQYSYFIVSEEMRRAKPPSHWREDIERKISKLSQELEIIKQFIDNRNPTNKMLSERVKRVLRKHQVHTNNRQSLELASRRIESSILNYQSKIKFADRRRKMIKDNRKFECYRSRFYREIDEHIVAAKQHHLQDRLQKRLDQHQQQDEDGEESESEKGREEDVDAQKPSLSSKILSTELRKEIVEYWQDIWRYHEKEFSHQNLLQNLRSCSYHSQSSQSSLPSIDSSTVWSENRINLVIDSIMSNLEHWKAPGPDMVYGFFIKKMTSLIPKTIELIKQVVLDPIASYNQAVLNPVSLFAGRTLLVPKCEQAIFGRQFRPITCLVSIQKIISKVYTTLLEEMIESNQLISINQYGTRKRVQASKELALINKCLINTAHHHHSSAPLRSTWIDIEKAYDSVNHQYLLDVLRSMKIPVFIVDYVRLKLESTVIELNLHKRFGRGGGGGGGDHAGNRDILAKISIRTGLIQGDSLSPLLFNLALEPLSIHLNLHYPMVHFETIHRNHLLYMDDIKLLATDEEILEQMTYATLDCLKRMGFRINFNKSATNLDHPIQEAAQGVTIPQLVETYTYLGVEEDGSARSKASLMQANIERIENRILERVDQLTETGLSGKNLFIAINEFATVIANYYDGLVNMTSEHFDSIDLKIRRMLYAKRMIFRSANIDRLYLKRSEMGRGLVSLVDRSEKILLKLHDHLDQDAEKRDLLRSEQRDASQLGIIRDFLAIKYGIDRDRLSMSDVVRKQREERLQRIQSRSLHSRMFQSDPEHHIDLNLSSLWLSKGYVSAEEEASFTKLQDRNIFTNRSDNFCLRCRNRNWSVEHVATGCNLLLHTSYIERHNEIVRYIHHQLARRYGMTKSAYKNYKVPTCISNERARISSNVIIETVSVHIQHNKPDICVEDYLAKTILIIDVKVSNRELLFRSENEKKDKYAALARAMRSQRSQFNVEVVPIVIGWDGSVTKFIMNYLNRLHLNRYDLSRLQIIALKKTVQMINADLRQLGDDDDETND